MKKLLFLLFAVIILTACESTVQYADAPYPKKNQNSVSVSSEVLVALQVSNSPDTMYVVRTDTNDYYFSQNKTLVSRYDTSEEYVHVGMVILLCIVFILFGVLVGALISSDD
jgi:hypothetical protein